MQSLLAVKFLDPKAIIEQLEIKEGMKIADFGCGPGYFSVPFAKAIGPEGVLYAIDVYPPALEAVESQAKIEGLHCIRAVRANLESEKDLEIEPVSLDLVIAKDVLFHNQDKRAIIKHAAKLLRMGGMMLVVEWNSKDESIGPTMAMRVKEGELRKMLEEENFEIQQQINAGNFHYGLIAVKK